MTVNFDFNARTALKKNLNFILKLSYDLIFLLYDLMIKSIH
jgi:hypothetical protein